MGFIVLKDWLGCLAAVVLAVVVLTSTASELLFAEELQIRSWRILDAMHFQTPVIKLHDISYIDTTIVFLVLVHQSLLAGHILQIPSAEAALVLRILGPAVAHQHQMVPSSPAHFA